MNIGTESILESREGRLPFIDGYDHKLAEYLTEKWQDAVDQLSDTLFDAMVVLQMMTSDGYRTALTCDRKQNPYEISASRRSSGNDFVDLVRDYGRMILIEDAREDSRLDESEELDLGFTNMIGLPVTNRSGTEIGVLSVLRKEPADIENKEVSMVTWLASSIEESIENYELRLIMNQIGVHDRLTHLITRERMMEMVQAEFDRSQRSEMPFSIVVIDIDNFRGINESYGHDVGDRVLQQFSRLILDRIRHIDYACRWDGDAFAVLLPQTEMIGANQLVSDLFFNLTHHIFPDVGRCYFSMGIADFSIQDENIGDMLLRLDKALYRVKAFGGNSHIARYH